MLRRHEDVDVSERRVVWAPWSPAQLVALVIGLFLLVLGAVTLANTGINGNSITDSKVLTWGFGQTPLLAIIEIVFGLLLVLAGAVPGAGRGTMALLGAILLAAGIVVLASSSSLYDSLGTNQATGWLGVVTGAVTLAAAMLAPIIFGGSRRAVSYDREVDRSERI